MIYAGFFTAGLIVGGVVIVALHYLLDVDMDVMSHSVNDPDEHSV